MCMVAHRDHCVVFDAFNGVLCGRKLPWAVRARRTAPLWGNKRRTVRHAWLQVAAKDPQPVAREYLRVRHVPTTPEKPQTPENCAGKCVPGCLFVMPYTPYTNR